ncbi:Lysophospholipase [Mycena indigotica]|uniref:Lysophospholipase n=1 Tax=Mycena indigotica TaxID=2126181 RepID=A0A8H6TCV3_9AGAR|nr:Lysophospholipase [Mycena indigotica]KAF7314974.1 Lysophospholipase [Mycena indigotica]
MKLQSRCHLYVAMFMLPELGSNPDLSITIPVVDQFTTFVFLLLSSMKVVNTPFVLGCSFFLSLVQAQLPPFSPSALAAYTPKNVDCPAGFTLVRDAKGLGAQESDYLKSRHSTALPAAFATFLANLASTKQPVPLTVKEVFSGKRGASPSYGLAFSGGAFRAALFDAGAVTAFDSRNKTSSSLGFGGILQGASYMSGLSGGGWFVTALTQANMPTVHELVFGPSSPTTDGYGGFNVAFDVLTPFGSNNTLNQAFIGGLIVETTGKVGSPAGGHAGLPDAFGLSLARHFANGTNAANLLDLENAAHGAGQLFSGISNVPAFKSHQMPFPIISTTLLSKQGNTSNIVPRKIVPLSNTKFEYNIFEFGSYDPTLNAFVPLQQLGTVNTSSCVSGFDQIAFVLGSTGDIFPAVNASALLTPSDPTVLQFQATAAAFQQIVPQQNVRLDAALVPNPFQGRAGFSEADEDILSLGDGGIDGANLPLQPLLAKARNVQTIIAVDVSSDTDDNYAAGNALIAESRRAALFPNTYKFPKVPATTTDFVAQQLNTRPTFFGCDEGADVPLIVYIPNGGPLPGQPAITNASTSQLSFQNLPLVQSIVDQAAQIVMRGRPQGQDTRDKAFPVCLACALAEGERTRLRLRRDKECDVCFERYCYKPAASKSRRSRVIRAGSR